MATYGNIIYGIMYHGVLFPYSRVSTSKFARWKCSGSLGGFQKKWGHHFVRPQHWCCKGPMQNFWALAGAMYELLQETS